MTSWCGYALLLLAFVFSCSAIYEDQVGLYDWHQQYIGRVNRAVFQTHGSGRKRVVVSTGKSVIASLNLRTGEIFWRQVLEEHEPIDGLEIVSGKYVITLSRGGSLRSWHLPDGTLVWETLVQASSSPSQLLLLPIDLNNDKLVDMVVHKGTVLYAVSSAEGRIIWTAHLQDKSFSEVSLSFDGKNVYAAGSSDSSLGLFRIDASNGEVTKLSTDRELGTSGLILTGTVLVALDSQGEKILTGDMTGEVVELKETSISRIIPSAVDRPTLSQQKISGMFVLSADGYNHVLDTNLNVIRKTRQPAAFSDSIALDEDSSAFAVVEHVPESNKVAVSVLSAREHNEDTIELESNRGSVQKVFLNVYTRTDRSRGFRALVVGEDDSLSLLQQGKVVWTREDALASIIDVTFAELPVEKAGVSVAEVEHDLAEWLKGHMLRLKSTLMVANTEEQAALQAIRLNSAEKTKMVRDHNGFRKLIVVLTSSGKLFALHTGDGRIVYSLLVPKLNNSNRGSLKLYSWKVPHKHALDENPVALILEILQGGGGQAVFVDMLTGVIQQSLKLPYNIKQVLSLPITDSSEQRLHVFIDDENKAHVYPATEESIKLFEEHSRNVYFYKTDKVAGVIQGFGMKSRIGENVFDPQKLWSIVFPKDSEVISATATRRPDEVVHTQAKVLANRDVLYKYLNKNVIFVATVKPHDGKLGGAAHPEETWLVAHLIDSVTGQILHRVSHSHAQGPVHAVFSENWVVYYYFNVRNHRHEMSVLEIYDKSSDDKDVLQLMLGRYNASVPFTSFSPRSLEVKGQSYFFTSTVKTMTVTYTAKGITGKQVLVGTIGNQVIALDKRFFDPRRTLSPTPAEREEGIIPLSEGLPVFPQSYITHAARVEGLRGIMSVPARLESTCLVFAHGTDVFFTRTAPSRTYDSLTEDFSYALLLITIVVLVVAIGVTMVLSQRKELREKWK